MKKILPFIFLGLASLFVIGFVFSKELKESKKYVLNESESQILEKILNKQQFINPVELSKLIESKNETFVLVDIRNPLNYRKGKIGDAINIPFQQIIDSKWAEFFKDSASLKILYCNLDIYANEAWMLLDQLGYRNIKVLEGGYDFWKENVDKNNKVKNSEAHDEIPAFKYKEEMMKAGNGDTTNLKQENTPPIQITIKKKGGPKGGCG
ncbi:MAG: rhodanese-like domain-containing protein [Bacteroidales bacterium]|nr:rhodanese-like domain-containing protein [Bacteroidales bacterium]